MSECPLCDEPVSAERPRHKVVLRVEDRTRPAKQITAEETEVDRYCLNQQVCSDCWENLLKKVS